MSRVALFAAILTISTGLFAQRTGAPSSGSSSPTAPGAPTTQGAVGGLSGQAAAGQTSTPSANTQGSPTVPGAMAGPAGTSGTTQGNPGNVISNPGTFTGSTTGIFVTAPLLATPTASFDAPQPTAGVSNAGRAGISNNVPINSAVTSTLGPSTMVYTTVPPVNVVVANPAAGVAAASAGGGRLINDMGPSYYADALPSASNVSLGEVSAQVKAAKGTTNARMLTNEEVQKMVANRTGVTVAKNMPPLGPGAAVQGGATSSTASQNAAAQPTSSAAQSGTQAAQGTTPAGSPAQSGAASQQHAGTPPPVDATQGQPAGQEAAAGTTPKINQKQQSNDAQGRSRLPATSTLLPLLGLLGLASGGLGLLFRKLRG
ncbi:MAG TPA: hypothetical protein VE133_04065 [Candidatus Sulfotelmatobacter sp.]|nr:hypothetical protein [Candidatus Sulfotelmatobacter sp.]